MATQTHTRADDQGPAGTATPLSGAARARIAQASLRQDRWWVTPAITVAVLTGFVVYGTWAAFRNAHYYADPYLSPFYSPCLTDSCPSDTLGSGLFGDIPWISPAILVLVFPLGFRLTCYYYRKAYYRSFWWAPPACAVPDARRRYSGETRLPLVMQNVHRYFLYFGVLFIGLLVYEAVGAFSFDGRLGVGVGTGMLAVNVVLLGLYTFSCHSFRHLCGGGLRTLSAHPVRRRLWQGVSALNRRHMVWAWVSLLWIMAADFYVWLVAAGHLHDYHWVA
ncbi:hypothetical protein [Protofrankia symbiont of Coriaria ruscifolia]|uniref:Integral membrane protein n=1 Tax=Candidatus Protofrankia californiensis TaxID=1839754 RepID=A0A1C3NX09_9ACTN|nr:hypothetical protein [Protofrankia symbiont of Coriaria ruscifolia]SBW21767.1 integral membrane protein [Candidatus Protofrankia californiensis]